MKIFESPEEAGVGKEHLETVKKWLDRGDGIAVYENQALDSANLGHRVFLSYGSPAAQLEVDTPPKRCPDIKGRLIGWKYVLVGIVGGPAAK